MRQAVERGAGLTRQLLAFARRQALKLETIDPSATLQGMRPLLERSLGADILVDINTAPDLWGVKTDSTQFELAILNLAVNARDAMPKGGVLTVSGANKTTPEGELVEIIVGDTGAGIPADVLQRVFEPCFTTKQTGQGTGLGLSQVYGIVTQSGGSVHIDSVVNEGTRVTLRLPRSADAVVAKPLSSERADGPVKVNGKSVLVVEDDDAVAGVVEEMLRQMGCASTRVASAQAALQAVDKMCTYDLVFSDVVMPGSMNGVDLAREIHRRYPGIPIVLTTGFSGNALTEEPFPVLRKPYQIEDFEHVVATALKGRPA